MKLAYVDLPTVVLVRTALVVADESDLRLQVDARVDAFKAAAPQASPKFDQAKKDEGDVKKGDLVFHELSKDWNK